MSDSTKATRATVQIGSIAVDGFRLPDGSYRMSQASAAEAIEEPPVYALRFLSSKDSKALLRDAFTDYSLEQVEVEPSGEQRGQTRINALPLEFVAAYWLYRAYRGNQKAFLLCWALLTESIDRRFDRAFGVSRDEDDWDNRLSDRIIAQLETDFSTALAEADLANSREKLLEQQLRELGVEPWELPEGEWADG